MSYNRSINLAVNTIDNTNKDLIALHHNCYICGQFYSTPVTARNHISIVHGYDIPGRSRGISRPIDKCYNYVRRKDTDEYNEAHYSYPSCWFRCPLDEIFVFHDRTIMEHNPRRITIESEDEYDMDMGTKSHGRGARSRFRSLVSFLLLSGLRHA